ncbi:MAG: cupin domain-containing protein [Oscillospiraceae bacterium]
MTLYSADMTNHIEHNGMNIFDIPKHILPKELTNILAISENVRIERIVSTGQVSNWYDQTETEWLVLLSGKSMIEYDAGETVLLTSGDTLMIPPHKRHRVIYTSSEPPCVWLCVFWK